MSARPWESEPDELDFVDDATGYPCHMQRHPSIGHWCAYIGVPQDHPWHGKGYSDIVRAPANIGERKINIDELGAVNIFTASGRVPDDLNTMPIDLLVRCHGGLTWAGKPYWGDDTRAEWWFGFDCAHAGDLAPKMTTHEGDVYRDVNYVKEACARACRDIAAAVRVTQ